MGCVWRGIQVRAVTFHQARAAGPLHGGDDVFADGGEIFITENIGILADADITALIPSIAPQNGDDLFAGDLAHRSNSPSWPSTIFSLVAQRMASVYHVLAETSSKTIA